MTQLQPSDEDSPWHIGRMTPEQAFDNETLELALEGMHLAADSVPALVGYKDGTMTFAVARATLRKAMRPPET